MPTYTLKDLKSGAEFDVHMSYEELQRVLDEDPNLKHVLAAPAAVRANGSSLKKAGSGWGDVLKEVKKNSGRNNTINV